MAALAESFGRGAMTNHWIDLQNADVILICGSNAAENHPISFKWVTRAQERGAKLIHVDPRFTRTSTRADVYAPLRSGSDIAFYGGMIHYILKHNKFFVDYVRDYTNGALLVNEGFSFQDGLFSGYDEAKGKYDKSTWKFQLDENGIPRRDDTMQNPRCVLQLLRKHYARYTPDKVAAITGMSEKQLAEIYELYSSTGARDRTGTMLYAMGQTQHTVGVQNIRAMAMIQLLLGNVGMAGGGINALRGESNVQGSTDYGLLWETLPGYLGVPAASVTSLKAYNQKIAAPHLAGAKDPKSAAWVQNYPKYMVSFLKAMYPGVDPETGYGLLPKFDPDKNYTWLKMFDTMDDGTIQGFFSWGQNPACGGANANKTRRALSKLEWLINVNIFDNETASFWKGPGMDPKAVGTEVFMLPCSVSIEKEGSISNSGRWMQWRYKGPEPLQGTLPDGEIIVELARRIRKLAATGKYGPAEGILAFNLDGCCDEHGEFNAHATAKLINGYFLKDVTLDGKAYKAGELVPSFTMLQADGSTNSGNWLYCASYTEKGNMAARRDKTQTEMQAKIGLFPNWSWCWPVNRRILYNRASVDAKGMPFAPQKAVIAWNSATQKWDGDVPDGGWAPGTKHPFIMIPIGYGRLFGPGRADGPFPEYYEPLNCPVSGHPFSRILHNPTALSFKDEERVVCDSRYPFVCTTYRVTEHWQTGVMTRYTPWLLEAEPQIFCEMSVELAKLRGIENGDTVILENQMGTLWAKAIVTERIKPFTVMGAVIHEVGIPWHYGWVWPKDGGDSANLLTPSVGDPNTGIPESKAFMVNVRKA